MDELQKHVEEKKPDTKVQLLYVLICISRIGKMNLYYQKDQWAWSQGGNLNVPDQRELFEK